jgi:protein SCO1
MVPLAGYFLLKAKTSNNVTVPRHYIYDSVIEKTENGKSITDTIWHQLPDFALTNQLGRQVSWKDLEGKVVVADFFFTRCPTICPQLTRNMKRMQDGISNAQRVGSTQADFVHFISLSVDPERDSVAALKAWANRFQIDPQNWWLLTGKKKEIYDLSIDHMKLGLVDGQGIDTSFFHTDYMVLIDKNRNIRGYYHGLDTAEIGRLSRDIVMLRLEKDPHRKRIFDGKLELIAVVFLITIVAVLTLMYFLKREKN